MNIAVYTTQYPGLIDESDPGGGTRVAAQVSRGLARRGHNVTVYTCGSGEANGTDGLHFRSYKPIFKIGRTPVAPAYFMPRSEKYDVINVHNTTPPGVIAGYLHSLYSKTPLVVTHHGNDRYTPMGGLLKRVLDYSFSTYLLETVLLRADLITLPTYEYLKESPRISKFSEKVVEIPNGLDLDEFHGYTSDPKNHEFDELTLDPTRKLILFIGRLVEKKDPETLLEAFNTIEERSAQLVIAGNGPLKPVLEEKANDIDHVHVPGYVSEDTKYRLLSRAEVLCLPSKMHTEVFPITMLEAYATETPVIASDIPTLRGCMKVGETGFVFEPQDSDSLASHLDSILGDPEQQAEMANNAKELSNKYSLQSVIDAYEYQFEKMCQ